MRLADAYRAFLLDLDGVVYRGDHPLPGAPETVAALRDAGRRVVFLTNNSARTPQQVAEKLATLGVPAIAQDVVTSAQVAAGLVVRELGRGARAFVVGEEGIRSALAEAGVGVVDGPAGGADVVVVGWDRGVNYDRLRSASVLVQRGARLVATNADASYPAPGGELWPGAGALLAAVEITTGARAVVAGKPHRPMFDAAVERAGGGRALVVGDRIDTDIAGARAAGLDAALVLSGAASPSDLLDNDALPVAVTEGLPGLLEERPAAGLRPAGPEDSRAIHDLLAASSLDPSESRSMEGTMVLAGDDGLVATAAADVRGDRAYVRSVAVREQDRGLHMGTLAVAAAVGGAVARGARMAFLVTESAGGFFARLGFEPLLREELPSWIRDGTAACSSSAIAMRRVVPAQ